MKFQSLQNAPKTQIIMLYRPIGRGRVSIGKWNGVAFSDVDGRDTDIIQPTMWAPLTPSLARKMQKAANGKAGR